MRNRGIRILVGLGLACLTLTGCASLVISGAMWAGKEVMASKKSPEGDDAKRSEAAQTNSNATEPQPASAAEPS